MRARLVFWRSGASGMGANAVDKKSTFKNKPAPLKAAVKGLDSWSHCCFCLWRQYPDLPLLFATKPCENGALDPQFRFGFCNGGPLVVLHNVSPRGRHGTGPFWLRLSVFELYLPFFFFRDKTPSEVTKGNVEQSESLFKTALRLHN